MPTLDIAPLRSFDAVVAFSGVRRAAQALHLSQSAVTGHIRKLERELGCPLVVREGRGIALTSDGEELAGRARTILQQHDDAVRELLPPADDELLVAATEHAAEFLVPNVVAMLNELLPNHHVRLRLTRSARVRDLVEEDRADVALMLTSAARDSRMVAHLPLEWYGTVGAPTDRLVLFSPPCAVRHQAIAALRGRDFTIVRECSDLTTVVGTARRGLGVTPLPRFGAPPDGLRRVGELPHVPDVPLYMSIGPRIPERIRTALLGEVRRRIGEAGAAPMGANVDICPDSCP
ncbi:LysR family transcriptional regulator [Gordonia sp. SL306]|uniref:LysR family transcriptional regulator n=1 Tax=Gordonia sp. SL306 TaxID=2995145 RepID=UPI00226DC081|nr:LysR family transcriptional regulator [Gordonia sp. SL306]WAC56941.1 LysR family transcriptional regulator [Gordonia sp. SL306]